MQGLRVYNKKLNRIEEEKIYFGFLIELLYGNSWLSKICEWTLLPIIAKSPFFSHLYGKIQSLRASKRKIAPFIKKFSINESEFEKPKEAFASFNDFFTRTLKKEVRPIDPAEDGIVSPCDARVHVIPKIGEQTSFMLKGKAFDLNRLVQEENLAQQFHGGSAFLARLCPTDYHRFHFPYSGEATSPKFIPGSLYSVNPIAVMQRPSIFWENKRAISMLHTDLFGDILMIEIGATHVGSIHYTYKEGLVKKGEEKGYFSFGGSSLMLIFKKDCVIFDPTLVSYSEKGIEVLVQMGEKIAKRVASR